MLFFKLYNWLKYKTLPSSFLFKNRLFIERDSKHRRISNNFGLTFRNSKWSNYENNNVNWDFKNNYLKFFFIFFTVLIFTYLLIFLNLTNNFFFSSLSFFFWFAVDTFDYYLTFIIWSFVSFVSFFFSKLYLFVNRIDNCESFESVKNLSGKFKIDGNSAVRNLQSEVFLSKTDLNWLLYSWLSSNHSKYSSKCTELLFDSSIFKTNWDNNFFFFIDLYQTIFFLNLNDKIFYDSFKTNHSYEIFNFFNDSKILNNYFLLISSFYYKKQSTDSSTSSLSFSETKWSLDFVSTETIKNNFLSNAKKGFFFLHNSSIFNLTSGLIDSNNFFFLKNNLIIDSLKHSLEFSKWNRWLYKYSLIHRKSTKYTQKLTFIKKLISNGFYNSSIFEKNLWNSTFFSSKNIQASQMTTFFDSYFNDFLDFKATDFSKKFAQNSFLYNDKNNFLFFKFFENSYVWQLKRLFLFNTLKTNFFSLKTFKDQSHSSSSNNVDKQLINSFSFNFFMQNRFFSLRPFNFFFLNEQLNVNLNQNNNSNLNSLPDDVFYVLTDLDLFDKEVLFFSNIISSNNELFIDNTFNSFKYFNATNASFNFLTLNFFLPFNSILQSQINALKIESHCFRDLSLFSLYFK